MFVAVTFWAGLPRQTSQAPKQGPFPFLPTLLDDFYPVAPKSDPSVSSHGEYLLFSLP